MPPTIWKKAVERLSKPYTREYPSAPLWAPCCSSLGTLPGGITNRLPPDAALLCPPCHSHTCCQLPCWVYLCCCPSMSSTWWPLTGTSHSAARDLPETGLKPAAQPVPLEDPKAEAVAVHAPHIVSSFSSSSSSSCEDLEDNLEMGLPQRLVVNSAVNTDPILPKRPLIRNSPRQPPWRYWRRNGLEPHPAKPGRPRMRAHHPRKGCWLPSLCPLGICCSSPFCQLGSNGYLKGRCGEGETEKGKRSVSFQAINERQDWLSFVLRATFNTYHFLWSTD